MQTRFLSLSFLWGPAVLLSLTPSPCPSAALLSCLQPCSLPGCVTHISHSRAWEKHLGLHPMHRLLSGSLGWHQGRVFPPLRNCHTRREKCVRQKGDSWCFHMKPWLDRGECPKLYKIGFLRNPILTLGTYPFPHPQSPRIYFSITMYDTCTWYPTCASFPFIRGRLHYLTQLLLCLLDTKMSSSE